MRFYRFKLIVSGAKAFISPLLSRPSQLLLPSLLAPPFSLFLVIFPFHHLLLLLDIVCYTLPADSALFRPARATRAMDVAVPSLLSFPLF